jgi:hypothetical protein
VATHHGLVKMIPQCERGNRPPRAVPAVPEDLQRHRGRPGSRHGIHVAAGSGPLPLPVFAWRRQPRQTSPPQRRKVSSRRIQMPAANAVLTTVVDTRGRSRTPRCPSGSSGLIRWTVVDSCGPGHSPEKPKATGRLSLIRSLIRLRPDSFGAHHARRTAQVGDVPGLRRTLARRLGKRVDSAERDLIAARPPRCGVIWTAPGLAGQVGVTEWTATGELRHRQVPQSARRQARSERSARGLRWNRSIR